MAEVTTGARQSSLGGQLARLGFVDVAKAARLLDDPALAGIVDPFEDLFEDGALSALGEAPDPDLALLSLVRILERLLQVRPDDPFAASDDVPESDRAHPARLRAVLRSGGPVRDRLVAVLGASAALGDHLARHPEHWTVLVDDNEAAPHARRRCAPSCCAPSAPTPTPPTPWRPSAGDAATDALRVAYRRRLLAIAGRDLVTADPVADDAVGRPRAGRPRRRRARDRARDRPQRAAAGRRAVPDRRHRHGQVRRPRAELRERRRRHLRRRAARGARRRLRRRDARRSRPAPGSPPAWPGPARRRRRRARSGRSTQRCGPRARPARSCAPSTATARYYRTVGRDLGVPGAAQGTPGRRRPRPRRGVSRRDRTAGLAGGASGSTSSRTSRRCAAGSRSTCRPRRPRGSSSSAQAACGTSSSASSCCSSCTAGPTRGCAPATRWTALEALSDLRLRRPRRRRRARPRLPLPAHAGAPDPAVPAAAHPRRPRRRARPAPARPLVRVPAANPAAELEETWHRHGPGRSAGCTRSSSTGRCSRPRPGSPPTRPGSRPRPRRARLARPRLPRPGGRDAPSHGPDRRA